MFKGFFYKRELTSLALVVIVALPLYAYFVKRFFRKMRLQPLINVVVFLAYLAAVFYFTLLGKHPQNERLINLTPFWSYEKFFEADYQWQIYMNILLFIPLGFLLPVGSEKIKLWKVFLFAVILSSIIEATQYFLRLGLCEFDDVFHNTLGASLGFIYWQMVNYIGRREWKRNEHSI